MTAISATLGGYTFNGSADGNGTTFSLDRIDGWEGPAIRQSFHKKMGNSGAVIGEANLDMRTIVVGGVAKGTSQANAWTSYRSFVSMLEGLVTAPSNFVVAEPGITSATVSVYLTDRPRIEWIGDRIFRYQFTITAPVPTITRV